jgi:DNA-3-methyladenine glycosylase I
MRSSSGGRRRGYRRSSSRRAAIERCPWCLGSDLEREYHDTEWGVPVHDDRVLFEFLILEGAQAGLSWATVLRKRESYRRAFDGFDPAKIARYGTVRVQKLLADPGIVRNRLKVQSSITNAAAFLELQASAGSFSAYLWAFVDGTPVRNRWRSMTQVPARTPLSDRLSRELAAKGFRFVGSTICYAYMQAVGLVNDHLVSCFRHGEI